MNSNLQPQASFTSYELNNILHLRNSFSIRIYELLKQYETTGEHHYEIEELKKMLGIGDEQYTRYSDFKRAVLFVTQKEIGEKTDICFDMEEIRKGQKVTGILFKIRPQSN